MFLGEYHRTIDSKNRIFIPAKFREELIKGVIITKGFDEKCLFLFSRQSWQELQSKIKSGPVTKKNLQTFSRWFFSSANEEIMDQQGRIKLPQNLKDYAGLQKQIVLVGVSDRAEIWAEDIWQKYYDQADDKFMEEDSTFEELGF